MIVAYGPAVSMLQNALSPLGQWFLIICGVGVGLACTLRVLNWGWYFVQDMIGGVRMSDWERDDFERELREDEQDHF